MLTWAAFSVLAHKLGPNLRPQILRTILRMLTVPISGLAIIMAHYCCYYYYHHHIIIVIVIIFIDYCCPLLLHFIINNGFSNIIE